MLMQIVLHTPKWVFAVFALLLWLGGRQLWPSRASLARTTVMPVLMIGLSLAGVASAFGDSLFALLGWAVAAGATVLVGRRVPLAAGTRYDPATRQFHLAGSAVPLVLMMSVFFTKYAVGVALAMHPELHRQAAFAFGIPMLYGALSGIFMARALRLWTLAGRTARQGALAGEARSA